jgi:hypothetical protein
MLGQPQLTTVLLKEWLHSSVDWLWILAHQDVTSIARVRVLIDFLYKALDKKINLLEGRYL